MIAVIEDGGYVRGMVDRLRELEARQDELNARLARVPADIPDIHPNVAGIYRRKVAHLAAALDNPGERDEAAAAIRGLIERIVLMPGARRGEMDALLHGDLGAILEWTGNGHGKTKTDTPMSGVSVSVVAEARNPRDRHLIKPWSDRLHPIDLLEGLAQRLRVSCQDSPVMGVGIRCLPATYGKSPRHRTGAIGP